MDVPTTTVAELKERLASSHSFFLLDVREEDEFEESSIEGATLIPLAELGSRLHDLDKSRETVVMCRSGRRSAQAVAFMQSQGFDKIYNLEGGILAWQAETE